MNIPEFTMRQLLEAGVHFGHRTDRWNPRMATYIYGVRGGIHVIDLTQTVPLLHQALVAIHRCVAKGGRLLLVATKSQAREPVRQSAERGQQFYINNRWLGGTLTNWKTVSNSIKRLETLERTLENPAAGFAKKERLKLERQRNKVDAALGGIRQMGSVPEMLFVIDVNEERLAIAEAQKLGIPVVAVVDTNSDPTGIDYPVPGNDDATRAVTFYCDLVLRVLLDALEEQLGGMVPDLGEVEQTPAEPVLETVAEPQDRGPAPAPAAVTAIADELAAELERVALRTEGKTEATAPQALDGSSAPAAAAEIGAGTGDSGLGGASSSSVQASGNAGSGGDETIAGSTPTGGGEESPATSSSTVGALVETEVLGEELVPPGGDAGEKGVSGESGTGSSESRNA